MKNIEQHECYKSIEGMSKVEEVQPTVKNKINQLLKEHTDTLTLYPTQRHTNTNTDAAVQTSPML
jgi:hypothetical protein